METVSGSGHTRLSYCCDSCYRLFNTAEALIQHVVKCVGDSHEMPQEFVAISKDFFMKLILPHVKQASQRSSESKISHDYCNDSSKSPEENFDTSHVIESHENRPKNSDKIQSHYVHLTKETTEPLGQRKNKEFKNDIRSEISNTDNTKTMSNTDITKPTKGKRISEVSEETLENLPKKKLKCSIGTVSFSETAMGEKSYRTRRKAAVDYKLLNDGFESQTSDWNKKSSVRETTTVGAQRSLTDRSTTEEISTGDNERINASDAVTDASEQKNGEECSKSPDSELSHRENYEKYKKYVHMEKGNRVMYHCPMCPKKTPFIGFFRRHMETFHNDGKGFVCETCNEKCINTQQYRLHMNKHIRPFACEECSCSFVQKKDLLVHAKLHRGEFSFFCEHCDYKCRQIKSLKEHMRIHDGNVLQCSHEGCDFQTIYAFALRSHVLSKHMEKSLHQCKQCKFRTNNRGCFNQHMKIHLGIKNYKCGMCEYKGRSKHAVVKHMSVHTGEKRYQCPACSYSTSHGYALRSHLLKHMGIRTWQCKACNFVGSQKQHVVRHATKKHPDYAAEDLVEKSSIEVKVDLSEFKTWENDSQSTNNEEILQLEAENNEELEAVTHIIFQDPDNPDGDQIMTIATEDLAEDQNVTIMTIDADDFEGGDETEGQIMTLATEDENVMIITEGVPAEIQDMIIDNQIEVHTDGYVHDSVLVTNEKS